MRDIMPKCVANTLRRSETGAHLFPARAYILAECRFNVVLKMSMPSQLMFVPNIELLLFPSRCTKVSPLSSDERLCQCAKMCIFQLDGVVIVPLL